MEHEHIVSHREIRQILLDAGLDQATAERDADVVHNGGVVVLADLGDREPDAVLATVDAQVQGSRPRSDQ